MTRSAHRSRAFDARRLLPAAIALTLALGGAARADGDAVAFAVTPTAAPASPAPSATSPAGAAATPTMTAAPPPALPVVSLSLKDAIVRGLANNPDLEVQRLSVKFARIGIDVPDGAFDPVFFTSGNIGKANQPFFSRNPFAGLPPGLVANPFNSNALAAGMRFRTVLGTVIEASYGVTRRTTENVFSLDPSYSPTATLAVTQPLLKGISPKYQTAAIEIARNDSLISEETFRDRALATALSVEEAYWNFSFTRANLQVAELALATAEQLLSINRQKLKFGNLPEIDVLVAESGVASRKEAVIVARNDILNARDALFRLILPQGAGRALAGEQGAEESRRAAKKAWDVDVIPLDVPRAEEGVLDVDKALTTAFEKRPDYRGVVLSLVSNEIAIDRAWHERLPKLDVSGSMNRLGLGKSWGNAFKTQLEEDYYEWQVGFNFEVPIFNTTPRAQYDQSQIQLAQSRKRLESLEQTIFQEVRTAARNVEAAGERMRATEVARKLADRQLENETKRLQAGLATSYDVQLSVQNQTNARTNFLRAVLDREIARARFERATATNLERRDVRFESP